MKAARCNKQALLAEPIEQLPQMYPSVRPGKISEPLSGIRQRVHMKRLNGQKLSTVERYLSTHAKQLERRLFGPSVLTVAADLLGVLLRPAPIILVLSIIVATERSSNAWLTTPVGETEGEVFEESEDYSEAFRAELSAPAVDAAERETERESTPTPAAPAPKEKVEFAALGAFAAGSLGEPPAAPPHTPISESMAAALPPVPQPPVPQVQPEQKQAAVAPTQSRDKGLVEFISGVIAVYYPSESDSGKLARYIVELSRDENLDPLYVAALIAVESRFKSHAKSSVGATGLMQLLPSTAREVVKRQFGKNGNPALTDPRTNIKLGIRYLKDLEKRYRGNRHLALAAYNWGPANVDAGKRIPGSVQKYATSILEKTLRWKRHFQKAVATASELEQKNRGRV